MKIMRRSMITGIIGVCDVEITLIDTVNYHRVTPAGETPNDNELRFIGDLH